MQSKKKIFKNRNTHYLYFMQSDRPKTIIALIQVVRERKKENGSIIRFLIVLQSVCRQLVNCVYSK